MPVCNLLVEVFQAKHERVVRCGESELYVRRHSLVGVDDGMYLQSSFFLLFMECLPTPLNIRLENSDIVVESMMRSLLIHLYSLSFWLSDKMCTFAHGYFFVAEQMQLKGLNPHLGSNPIFYKFIFLSDSNYFLYRYESYFFSILHYLVILLVGFIVVMMDTGCE